jgi:beta-lactam-binding protein with PASTA domain
VTGLSQADAQATLTTDAYQFVVTVEEEPSETVDAGFAIRTDPAAGSWSPRAAPSRCTSPVARRR